MNRKRIGICLLCIFLVAALCCPTAVLASGTFAPGPGEWPQLKDDCGLSIQEREGLYYIVGLSLADPGKTIGDIIDSFECPEGSKVEVSQWPPGGSGDGMQTPVATNEQIMATSSTGSTKAMTLVVMGDVLGTGKMSLAQITTMVKALTGTATFVRAELMAGDFGGSGNITLSDLLTEVKLFIDPSSASVPDVPPIPSSTPTPSPTAAVTPAPSQDHLITVDGLREAAYLLANFDSRYDSYHNKQAALAASVIISLTDLWKIREGMADGWWDSCTLLEQSFPLSSEITEALDSAVVQNGKPCFTEESVYKVAELLSGPNALPEQASYEWLMVMHCIEDSDPDFSITYFLGRYYCDYEWIDTPFMDVTYRAPEPFVSGQQMYGLELTSINNDPSISHYYMYLAVKPNQNAPLGFYVDGVQMEFAGETYAPGPPGGDTPPPLKPFPYDKF